MPIAMEQPKRPVGGAYGIFANEKRAEFLEACKGQKACEVSKMSGEAWKKLTDAQKKPYQKKYEDVKAKFDKDMAAFLDAGGEKVKGIRAQRTEKRKERDGGKKKKDPNAPKRPVGGAFGIFLNENREKIIKSLPAGSNKSTDVSKAAGEQWKKLSAAAQKTYQEKYEKKKEEFEAAMEEYKKTLPADAGEEDENDDEEEEEEDEEEESEPSPKKGRKGAKAGA